jgi:hypothetical protein
VAALDYHVKHKSADPYGEVLGGWIGLLAPLVSVSFTDLREKDENKVPPERRPTRLKTAWGSPFGGNSNFDSIKDYDNEGRRAYEMNHELFALVLAQREGDISIMRAMLYTIC